MSIFAPEFRTCLNIELSPPAGLLHKNLAIAERRLPSFVAGGGISLPQTNAANDAVQRKLAERPSINLDWGSCL